MSKSTPPRQPAKAGQERAEDDKAQRLAAALRDNLRRRKAQQRARDDTDGGPADRSKPGGAA